ncbi:MAG: hypothetical protein Fur0022_19040 [Anaerolineales bacterium]
MPLNIINYTPLVEHDGSVSPLNKIIGNLRFGGGWFKELQAQDTVISILKKLLTDRFTLVRNFTLPDEEIPIPMLLISGSGVWLIAVTDLSGIFKAEGKEMYEMDTKSHEFVPHTPNLLMRTILMSRAFEEFLQKHKIPLPPIEPVLIFTNPGVDVRTGGEVGIRVLLIDALNRFVSNLAVTPVRMEPGTTKKIVELIKYTHTKAQQTAKKSSGGLKLKFSPKQWIILGAMIVVLVLTVILFLFLIANL